MNKKKTPSSAELLRQIQDKMLQDPTIWSDAFERLEQAIAEAKGAGMDYSPLTCSEASERLDILVSDEIAGLDVGQRHRDVMLHLVECESCRVSCLLLRETLLEEQQGRPILVSSSSATSSQPVDRLAHWQRQDGTSPHPFPLAFQIAHDFVSKALRGPQLAFARGDADLEASEEYERETLLLTDVVSTDQGDLIIEVVIRQRVDRPEAIGIEVRLVSDWPLPDSLQACLSWTSTEHLQPVDEEGRAYFSQIPFPSESEGGEFSPDLKIAFVCP